MTELVTLRTGPFGSALHKSDYITDGIPLVNPTHIINTKIVSNVNITVSKETADRLSEFRLSVGDIVLGRRGKMGRSAVVTESEDGWLCGTGSLIVRPSAALDPRYLQRFLASPETVERLEDTSVGSTMANLNQNILLSIIVPLPPLNEQKRIADKLETLLTRVTSSLEKLERASELVKQFRQAVLAAATAGTLTEDWRKKRDQVFDWKTSLVREVGKVQLGR